MAKHARKQFTNPKKCACSVPLVLADTSTLVACPTVTLVEPENEIVVLKVVDNAIDASVAPDGVEESLPDVDRLLTPAVGVGAVALGLKERNAEASRLEDPHDLLDNLRRGAPGLAAGDVGLERGKGTLGLGGDVDSPVMSSARRRALLSLNGWDHAVSREAAGAKGECIDLGIGEDGGRVDAGETATLRNDGTQCMAFNVPFVDGRHGGRRRIFALESVVEHGRFVEAVGSLPTGFLSLRS